MSARVLVVDDVEANVKLLEAKLSSEYFDVLSAYNGRTALQIADSELPDVILLDVMMPRMDGFEVCRRLKANPRTADVPVVMVTALSDVGNRLRGLEVGADDFLTKPVNDIALFARVRSLARLKRMMEEWRLREEICGRFAGRDIAAAQDTGPATIVIVEEDRFAAAQMAETLRSVGHSVTCAAGGADAQTLLDGDTELIIVSLSMPSCDPLRLVSQYRANEAFRQLPDPADRRGYRPDPGSPKASSIWAPTIISFGRWIGRSCWRVRPPRSAARGCRTGYSRIINVACRLR